jgi:hypothetical protein
MVLAANTTDGVSNRDVTVPKGKEEGGGGDEKYFKTVRIDEIEQS